MKKRILSVLITVVMLIGVLPSAALAAGVTDEIHWAVVQKDSDVILYLGNAAHVMQTGETLYADGAQGINNMVLAFYSNQPYRTWYMKITKVVVESEIQPASCAYWFYDLFMCTEMDLRLLNTGSVTSMKAMFTYCPSLTTLTWDTSKFTTANVTTMESMFSNCEKLTSLDLSHFDTSKVTNMLKMFYRCNELETLDLSSFDTSDVTDMAFMFSYCYKLAHLDLSNFDLSGIAESSSKSLFPAAGMLTLKTPKINPYADAFGFYYDYSDEQGNLYTALPVSESAEGVKTLYRISSIQYYLKSSTGGEGNPTRYAYDKAYSITLTTPQKAGFVFDGWKVDEGPEGVTVVGNTLTIPQYTAGTVYIETLWKPYTVPVSGSFAPYTATIVPFRDDVTYSWHEYSFGSNEITDESAIYISEYSSSTYDPETGWTPDQIEYAYFFFDVSLKSGDTVTVTFADAVDVDYVAMIAGEWEEFISGVAQAENVILFTIPEDGIYTLATSGIDTTAKAIHTGVSISNTAAFTGATFSTGEIGTQYVARATFTDGGKEFVAYSDPFTYAEHIVTFDYGTLGSETKTVLSGETVTPPTPVFSGKVLIGWYDDAEFTTAHDFSVGLSSDITLYAKFADYETDLEEINDAINDAKAELEDKIDALEDALSDKADASALADALTELANAKANIQTLLSQIDDYADADTALKAELKGYIDTADNAVKASVSELTDSVNELKAALTTASGKIDTNANDVASLKADVSELKSWKTSAADIISALEALTATQDASISALEDALDALEAAATTANDKILAAENRIATLEGKVTELERAKAALESAIDALESALENKADALTVNAAIANLQNAISELEAAKNNYASADTALKAELENAIAQAKREAIEAAKGYIPYIGDNGNWWIGDTDTGVDANGIKGDAGDVGADGVGIAKIEKTSSKNGVDTYTITLTNGQTYTFTVTNGINGTNGKNGKDGVDGEDGKDGKDGKDGADGIDGKDGKDGLTPYIGENGNWWIGDTDTGVNAGANGNNGNNGALVATAIAGVSLLFNLIIIACILLKKKKTF